MRGPAENLLGELGLGHRIAFNILNVGRLKLGARRSAAREECLEIAVKYASDRKQFGQPLVEFGAVQREDRRHGRRASTSPTPRATGPPA